MNHRRLRAAPLISDTSPGLGSFAAGSLAVADVQLAEPAQLPAHVVQVEHAGLVDPQADVGLQPGGGVVPATGANFRQVASSSRHPANSRSTSASVEGMRNCARPRRAAGSPRPAGTRPPGPSGCRSRPCVAAPGTGSRPSAPARLVCPDGLASRRTRPNQFRIRSGWPVSLRIVLSASRAEARASTNPASTSVSNASISSALDGSRMSRTSASAPLPPRLHPASQATTADDIVSRGVKKNHRYVSGR